MEPLAFKILANINREAGWVSLLCFGRKTPSEKKFLCSVEEPTEVSERGLKQNDRLLLALMRPLAPQKKVSSVTVALKVIYTERLLEHKNLRAPTDCGSLQAHLPCACMPPSSSRKRVRCFRHRVRVQAICEVWRTGKLAWFLLWKTYAFANRRHF